MSHNMHKPKTSHALAFATLTCQVTESLLPLSTQTGWITTGSLCMCRNSQFMLMLASFIKKDLYTADLSLGIKSNGI